MNNYIADFYKDIDSIIMRSPRQLAVEYLKFVTENSKKVFVNTDHCYFVTSDNTYLSELTKKLFLVSDGLTLSCKAAKSIRFDVDYSNYEMDDGVGYFAFENNLFNLGIWLRDAKDLLVSGKISYFPNIYTYKYNQLGEMSIDKAEIISDVLKVTSAYKKSKRISGISQYYGENILLSNELVMELNIPIINNISVKDFGNIMLENIEATERFQSHLRKCLHCIDYNSTKQIRELANSLQNQAMKLGEQYKFVENRYYRKSSVLMSIGIVKAMLYIIHPEIAEYLMNIPFCGLGWEFGEVVIDGIKTIRQRRMNEEKIHKDDLYFLWLIYQEN